jgi:hypothetical protein
VTAWTDDDPGAGDVDAVRVRASALRSRIDHAADMTVTLRSCTGHLETLWSGVGYDAWTRSADASVTAWSSLQAIAQEERAALTRYAEAVESIHERARRQRAALDGVTHEVGNLHGPAGLVLEPLLLAARITHQEDLAGSALAALTALAAERQAADDALVAALGALGQDPGLSRPAAAVPTDAALAARGPGELLTALGGLSAAQLSALVDSDPALVARLRSLDPTVVAEWWASLDGPPGGGGHTPSAEQEALIVGMPGVIGNLDGVAYWARDRANTAVLDAEIARLNRTPAADPGALVALTAVRSALGKRLEAVPPRELISFSLDGNPKAAISVGDLDAAEHVSYVVPGMGTRVATNMGTYTEATYQMLMTQRKVTGAALADLAVVAWLDYDAPGSADLPGVQGDYLAEAGASRLARNLHGLSAVRHITSNPADTSVIAHSYGTNVATLALTQAPADHVVLLGSAGISREITDASGLFVPHNEVYASQGHHDGWAPVGQFISRRSDPTDPDFGARDFNSEAGTDDQGRPLHAVDMHGPLAKTATNSVYSYLDGNTSAQFNTAKATMGRGNELTTADTPSDRLLMQARDRLLPPVIEAGHP